MAPSDAPVAVAGFVIALGAMLLAAPRGMRRAGGLAPPSILWAPLACIGEEGVLTMDPVTHGLAGFLVGQAAFRHRRGLPAALAVTAGALAPDVDAIAFAWDRFAVLTYHRGLTHSLVGIPALAAATAALVWLLTGRRGFARLTGLAALGIGIHILLDLPTAFGTRVLYPLSAQRFRLDLFHVVDPALTTILAMGLLAAWRWRVHRRLVLGASLAAITVYAGLAFDLRRAAEERFRTAAERLGPPIQQVAILPRLGSPLVWRGVGVTAGGYLEGDVALWSARAQAPRHVRDGSEEAPLPEAVEVLEAVRRYRQFARFPLAVLQRRGDRRVVAYQDLAFGPPGPSNDFYLTVTLNGAGAVEAIRFNHRF